MILLLYILAALDPCIGWAAEIVYTTFPNGESFWTAFEYNPGAPIFLAQGIDAILSTILADTTLAWSLISALEFLTYEWLDMAVLDCLGTIMARCASADSFHCLGSSSSANVNTVSRGIVAYYSTFGHTEIVLVVFEARNELARSYIEALAILIRGIAPTIMVGRVAAGHARLDDSWSGNAMASSIRFQTHSSSRHESRMSAEAGQDTLSPHIRPDLEMGLEDSAEVQVEGAAPNFSAHDCVRRDTGFRKL
ncbi:hypothetical protein IW261DRAFT_1426574 [Armillaria novae-zelandiae]|uniref:Uncharacterized protein n=1 Tax=Armillaria novae-zelandiae TaxID=153914 RepID=A0AA39NKW0_9AGAR|nr:hypothetical protein IW261DRAFT_1426574 [Armillaria novae-zelandiae]